MTAYDALPTVSIGGVIYTSATLNSLTTVSGRNTVDEQPRPGYATISIINVDGTYPNIRLNDPAIIRIKDSAGAPVSIFSGYVTDVARVVQQHGDQGTQVGIDVTIAGPLLRLNRFTTASNYPKEFDGDRVEAILAAYEATSWNELDPMLQWEDVNPTTTWLTYDINFVGNIDTPGSYEITAYNGGETSVLSHIQQVADSAMGVLWESPDGLINYSDATSRLTKVINDGFLDISAEYLQATGLGSKSSLGDLINQMTIVYKTGQTTSGSDLTSIAQWGLFAGSKTTLLENLTDAQDMVELYLTTRSYPRNNLQTVTIPLHNPDLPDVLRDALISIRIGDPVTIPNIPNSIYSGPFEGFVEGVTFTVTRVAGFVTLYLSEYALSQIEQVWQQVDDAELWNTISATLTWQEATVVA